MHDGPRRSAPVPAAGPGLDSNVRRRLGLQSGNERGIGLACSHDRQIRGELLCEVQARTSLGLGPSSSTPEPSKAGEDTVFRSDSENTA